MAVYLSSRLRSTGSYSFGRIIFRNIIAQQNSTVFTSSVPPSVCRAIQLSSLKSVSIKQKTSGCESVSEGTEMESHGTSGQPEAKKRRRTSSYPGAFGKSEGHATAAQSAMLSKRKELLWPPMRKEMTELDTSAFDKDISIPALVIYEDQMNPEVMRQVKPYLLKIPGIKPVQEVVRTEASSADENNSSRVTKRILLNPEVVKKQDLKVFVAQLRIDPKAIAAIKQETVKFTYENWSWNQIFDSILPDDQDKVSSFSTVGQIVHLNLRDHQLPYKQIIGKVLLDKVANAKTVVNKLGSIDNTFRNFQMEILAGDPNTIVIQRENRCEYEFDFAHVYWNPRLSSEHERLVKLLEPHEVLYDVFAGVGPFAIPAGKKRCNVLANDLNPQSFKWLEHNVKKNKVQTHVRCFNQDGRDFIRTTLAEDLTNRLKASTDLDKPEAFDLTNKKFHVAMNLPAIAVEFLDAFWGILSIVDKQIVSSKLKVMVHVYCFIKDVEGFQEKAVALVESKLNYKFGSSKDIEAHFVRNVAPNKEMYRVSFLLPHKVMVNAAPDTNAT